MSPSARAGSTTTCRSCGAVIRFERTTKGRVMPVDVDTGESHFKSCPDARSWSRKDPPKRARTTPTPARQAYEQGDPDLYRQALRGELD